jgi:hypothetical protein
MRRDSDVWEDTAPSCQTIMGGGERAGGVGCPNAKNSTMGVALPKLLSFLKAEMVMSELLTIFTSNTFL